MAIWTRREARNISTYLGMDLDYSEAGKVKISMEQFTRKVIEEFPDPLTTTAEPSAGENLFTVCDDDDT